ncbi:metalloregulator ArsR/SmtB family transcription factor [Nocardia rhamnosiphila]|uniref:metalloregulator ArsR/SmtB family transcription factor n=1 Tax=Nocardia rhamnosiphila TaxID=426716 RepID=UPI003F4CC8FE
MTTLDSSIRAEQAEYVLVYAHDSSSHWSELPPPDLVDAASTALRMLSDPTRLRLLWLLSGDELDVGSLAARVSLARPAISQHLAKLELAGLVVRRRAGRRMLYRTRGGHVRRLLVETLNAAEHGPGILKLAALPDEGLIELVWEDEHGQITSTVADETQFTELAAQVTGARAATTLSLDVDERHPLFTAVLPDSDSVLRARWRTEPTPSDRNWALLKTLHRGQICNGTVREIANFGVFVDIGGFTAMINIPELSWRPVNHPSEILTLGQEITAQVLDVDMVRERVALSLKALQEDPMLQIVQQVGQIVRGRVTKLMPFGAFVRIEDRRDGFEGLVRSSELAAGHVDKPEDVVQVGDDLHVKVIDVDPKRRRITLSRKQAVAAT